MKTARMKTETLGAGTLAAAILCESIYYGVQNAGKINARSFVFYGAAAAAASGLLILLFRLLAAGRLRPLRRGCAWLCAAAAALGAGQTVVQALALFGDNFEGSAGWLLAFFLLTALWQTNGHALDSAGWALRWLGAAAAVVLLGGVWAQLSWENLSFRLEAPPRIAALAQVWRFYPEYLAIPFFLRPGEKKHALALPFLDQAVRLFFVLLTELLFGAALAARLQSGEVLRAWGMGIFSRYDSFLLLIWLMLALLRVAVLAFVARGVCGRAKEGAGDE